MNKVARYGTSVARPGRGGELAEHLLAAAAKLEDDPGCELYLVSRERDAPDTIWVTELWGGRADLDAAVEKVKGSPEVAAIMELVERFDVIELELLGGKGAAGPPQQPDDGIQPYTLASLIDTKDSAPEFGFGEIQEARFATGDLAAQQTGVSHHRLRAGMRQPFAHRHERAEEVYVVLSGSGRIKLDDTIEEIGPLDAIRIAPAVIRAFEASPDGLELIVFGARHSGDGELLNGWWTD